MWPAIASSVYYVGIGVQAVLAFLLGRWLGVKPRVSMAVSLCYLLGMVLGAKLLFNVQRGTFEFAGLLRQDFYLQGLWGGPLVYLALAIPAVLVMTRRWGDKAELNVLSPEGAKPMQGSRAGVQRSASHGRAHSPSPSPDEARASLPNPLASRSASDGS